MYVHTYNATIFQSSFWLLPHVHFKPELLLPPLQQPTTFAAAASPGRMEADHAESWTYTRWLNSCIPETARQWSTLPPTCSTWHTGTTPWRCELGEEGQKLMVRTCYFVASHSCAYPLRSLETSKDGKLHTYMYMYVPVVCSIHTYLHQVSQFQAFNWCISISLLHVLMNAESCVFSFSCDSISFLCHTETMGLSLYWLDCCVILKGRSSWQCWVHWGTSPLGAPTIPISWPSHRTTAFLSWFISCAHLAPLRWGSWWQACFGISHPARWEEEDGCFDPCTVVAIVSYPDPQAPPQKWVW